MIATVAKKISAIPKYAQGQNNAVATLDEPCFEQCTEPWYAAYVRSRHEKVIVSQLSAKGITQYLPLIERLKKWSDRRVMIKEPIFPGYVFVNISYENRVSVLEIRGVVRLVGPNIKELWPIPVEEIKAIHKALNSNLACDPYPYLNVGKEVCVMRGPLQGCQGILIEKNKKHRLVLSIHLIGQSISVEIDAADVKPL